MRGRPTARSLAPAAACVAIGALAGPAGAQGSITLYGIVDTAVEWSDAGANRAFQGAGGNAGSATRLVSGQAANSKGARLGVRGVEDLGGGLRAVFAIEHRYAVDTGAPSNPAFWNGQAWIGVEGGWGRVSAGRQTTPMFNAMIAVDASSDQWYGTLVNSAYYATRFDNSLQYRSPRWNGLRLFAMAATNENPQDRREQHSFAAVWESPTWIVSGAWQRLDAAAPDGTNGSTVQLAAGVAWRAGAHQFGAGWMSSDPSGGGRRVDHPYLSVRLALGDGNLYVNVIGAVYEADPRNSVQYAIAYDRPVSHRTRLYVAASLDADVRIGGTPTGAATHVDARRLALGVRHDF